MGGESTQGLETDGPVKCGGGVFFSHLMGRSGILGRFIISSKARFADMSRKDKAREMIIWRC